ncbi:MAG: DUF4126 domain-containing protein [Rhodospirillaceae bacterium]|nr:DUF4126 domain-containing protein [Rhodospirillaceae bacterium]MDD9928643.1 DUF4126 domain-containing protein [Rhodospirillaceae bacterium]
MDALSIITLAMGAAWASGINLYATVLLVGLLGTFGLVPLQDGLSPLTSPIVLGVAGVAYVIEFFADKIPGLDSIWDGIHTFIRIPAGAAMAAGATAGLGEDYMVALALLGGAAVAAGSHATKAGSRAVINTSPEPVTNWAASFFEDVLVVVGLLLALFKPAVFLIFVLVFFLAALWLLPKIWRGLRRLHQRFAGKQGPDAIADQRPGFELSSLDRND